MRGTSSAEIRSAFLGFFEGHGHTVVPSSSLVPADDPTLLFTNAGMNQFKDVFTGRAHPGYRRATSAQKCVRAGGKHNDLDSVGRTTRHNTFFEMLGNFSFGDYFKREAIGWGWQFVTRELGLPPDRLWVTVFRDDDEAAALWRELAGLPAGRIVRLGEKDNFWAMGDTGPCGPCSEIYYDRGPGARCDAPECAVGVCDCDRWVEIWNLVFMQYERDASGGLAPLPRPSIDTGMGLERVSSVLQGVASNFDTDLFRPIIAEVRQMCGRPYDPGPDGFAFRVIADHARACCFLVADGVLPGNEGRAYVLRRILRRAVRFGRRLGLTDPFLWRLRPAVARTMGGAYPELELRAAEIDGAIRAEEERFGETLEAGLALLERAVEQVTAAGARRIDGQTAFRLHDTYGFPLDLTTDVAAEAGLTVDTDGFARQLEGQRQRARADRRAHGRSYGEGVALADIAATAFDGYELLAGTGAIAALFVDGQRRDVAEAGEEALVVLDRTPFYGEAGGQVGDCGVLRATDGGVALRVEDTRRQGRGVFVHRGRVEGGPLRVGTSVLAEVDAARRLDVARNHSATHLLHRALREVLGTGVHQAGSLCAPDRLRFDFACDRPVTPAELEEIAALVNAHVLDPLPVEWLETDLGEARRMGAMALFGEKYGERVRVVRMGDWSLELCGGTHVRSTAEVGAFCVLEETGIGSGVRRMEAVTGRGALQALTAARRELSGAAAALRARPDEVAARARDLAQRLAQREKELAEAQRRQALGAGLRLVESAALVAGRGGAFRVASGTLADVGTDDLRALADDLRRRLGSGGVLLASTAGGRGTLLCALTPDLVARGLHAGRTVSAAAAAAGGKGGGRADLAHAGAPDATRVEAALAAGVRALREQAGEVGSGERRAGAAGPGV